MPTMPTGMLIRAPTTGMLFSDRQNLNAKRVLTSLTDAATRSMLPTGGDAAVVRLRRRATAS